LILALEAWGYPSDSDVVMAEKRPDCHVGIEGGIGRVSLAGIVLMKFHELRSNTSLILP